MSSLSGTPVASPANVSKAVVVFSGGQDSTTCLIQALAQYDEVHAITFNYGQRHSQEIAVAQAIAGELGVTAHKVLDLSLLNELAISSLTRDAIPVSSALQDNGLPNTFVPGRNILFLTLAAVYAYQVGAEVVITGVCETDFSGYPDCRPEYIAAFEAMSNLATKAAVEGAHLKIHAPLINLSKAEIIRRGNALGVDYGLTISCYQADESGRACGVCDSCRLRREGFMAAGVPDPTAYQMA